MSDSEPTVLAGALEEPALADAGSAGLSAPQNRETSPHGPAAVAGDGAIHPPVETAPVVADPAPEVSSHVPGTLVEYCLAEGHGIGEWRPALLIKEWQPGYWSLCVFTDGGNDGLDCPRWVPAVLEGTAPGFFRLKGGG